MDNPRHNTVSHLSCEVVRQNSVILGSALVEFPVVDKEAFRVARSVALFVWMR